ncbi:MAG: hypothetical protein OHK0023_21930 [Anaerolineae bacterium]
MSLTPVETQLLDELERLIHQQIEEGLPSLNIERLMQHSPYSRRQTERLFRARFLTSPARFFRDCQADRARTLLLNGEDVLSAAYQVGFASAGRLHDAVIVRSGMTPGELRRRGAGVLIRIGFFETQLGVVLIAATERGVSALQMCGAAPTSEQLAERITRLRQEFAEADFDEDPVFLQAYADALVAFLDARTDRFCPPLDILQGSTFQREVWAELQRLHPGETVSYAELARRIGKPSAVRAVARACATNRVAIAIPCHRAVRSDGSLAGYRWGLQWKMRLLELEASLYKEAVLPTPQAV